MKNFLVNLSKKHKELLSSLLLALVTGIVLFAALFGINKTVAWFASNKEVDAGGLAVAVKGPKYDILIERNYTEFDRTENGNSVYPDISEFKKTLASEGYSSNVGDISVNSAGLLAYNLVNLSRSFQYEDVNEDTYYLMPGSYGYLTFYVRPVDPTEVLTIEFNIDVIGYYDDNGAIGRVTNNDVANLLKGHLLFFKGRTGEDSERSDHKYSGLLNTANGIKYNFDTRLLDPISTEDEYNGCYEVTLYWEWPLVYSDISENISDNTTSKKYPEELGDFLVNQKSFFFTHDVNSDDFSELSYGYDDGDQTIGNNCQFLVVFVTAYTEDD